MNSNVVHLQVYFEIAMAIGNGLELSTMLKQSLSAYLRTLNCSAAMVLAQRPVYDRKNEYVPVFSLPCNINENLSIKAALQELPCRYSEHRLTDFLERLPICGSINSDVFHHIMALQRYGLLVLCTRGIALGTDVVKSLQPLNIKLAQACLSCEQNEQLQNEIYERKKAETALKSSNKKYKNIFENAVEGIFQVTVDGHILAANQALATLFGYETPEAMKTMITEFAQVCYEEPFVHCRLIKTLKSDYKVKSFEMRFRRKSGEIFTGALTAQLIRDDVSKKIYLEGMLQDITRRKEMEALELAKQTAEAKANARSSFLANMSHEIRSPLNTILGFSSLLKETDDSCKRKEYIENVISSGRLLLSIIDDILDLSSIEKGKFRLNLAPIGINKVLNNIQTHFASKMAQKNLTLNMQIAPELQEMVFELDKQRLTQVLINLVDNAYKYTKQGGIVVSANLEYRTERCDLIFTVQDSGIGIKDPEIIFEAFEQLSSHSKGVGLGLAIVKRLVNLMNGQISVQSRINQGSTFEIRLFAVNLLPGAFLKKDAAANNIVMFEPNTVMIVDDNANNRKLAKNYLHGIGLDLCMASDGKSAVDMARSKHIDLILMDLKMPVMDGVKATQQIKNDNNLKSIPVVVLTADTTQANPQSIQTIGCDGFLLKPVDKASLLRELQRFLPHRINNKISEMNPDGYN